MKRKIRDGHLSPLQAALYNQIREQVMSEPTVAIGDVPGLYVVTGEPLSVEDKFNLLQELFPVYRIGRQMGVFTVWASEVSVADNAFIYSVAGRGETFGDAVSDLFKSLTNLPEDKFISVRDKRYRWNGLRFESVPVKA